MNKEELQEFLKEESNKDLFLETVKSMGYEAPEDIEGLKKNNRDLKAEKQKIKENYDSLQKRLDELEKSYYDTNNDNQEEKKYTREIEKLTRELKEAQEKASKVESEYNSTLIDRTISEALEEAGFTQHKAILKQAHLGRAKIEQDGDSKLVLINDGEQELPAKDYFRKQAEDSLKQYLDKPVNSGAGSASFQSSGSKVMNNKDFRQLSGKEQSKFISDGGQLVE